MIAASLLLGISLLSPAPLGPAPQRPFDFFTEGPYDSAIPRPEKLLRYNAGERTTTFRDQEVVVLGIAEKAKSRVKVIPYGYSTQGRPLKVLAISDPKNIARLDAIQTDLQALGNPEPGKDYRAVLKRTPTLVWINQCIHGDETASFESAMWLLYNLAASRGERIQKMLENTVVMLNPVYNPDGHERFVVWSNQYMLGNTDQGAFEQDGSTRRESSLNQGRQNFYRFDMNRDRVSMSQAETRQEVAEFLKWNPHVYADQHGQTENYFLPPNPMAINANVDRARINKWADVFGRAIGKRFDQNGWTYFIRDVYDFYYPGYLDSWTSLSGAIGMTHETDGGYYLKRLRGDGSTLTLRDGMEKHFTSALALIESASQNREALLQSALEFKQRAVSGAHAGKFRRVVVESKDIRPLVRLRAQLELHGIKSAYAMKDFTQSDAHDFWSETTGAREFPVGSLIIDMAQAQGPLAKALLEPSSDFEPEFLKAQIEKKKTAPEGEKYPGPESSEFYDLTGWSLIYAHNLKAWWCETATNVPVTTDTDAPATGELNSPVGYAIPYTDLNDILAVFDALRAGVRGMALRKNISVAGVKYGPGTFIFLAARNEPGFEKKLLKAAEDRNALVLPLLTSYPDERWGPGSENVIQLRKPKIGVVFGSPASPTQFGHLWYLMDKVFELPFTPLSTNALNGDLSDYTAIVLPSGANASASGRFRDWIAQGGCAISLESISWAVGKDKLVELDKIKGEPQSLPGSLFRANIDARSFLSYGYGGGETGKVEIAVPIAGDTFYTVRKEGGSMVSLSDDEKLKKLLTGWAFPDDTEKNLRNTIWAQDVPVGSGHAVLFTNDVSERAMWPGLYKMLLNAVLFGSAR
ncbi:MAG: M14 family zinc carboxypeptidase [Fimbriimonas sp.]